MEANYYFTWWSTMKKKFIPSLEENILCMNQGIFLMVQDFSFKLALGALPVSPYLCIFTLHSKYILPQNTWLNDYNF
jgi:hypothetical protein